MNLRYSVLFPQNPPYFVVFFSLSIGFEGKYKADSFFQSLSGHPRQKKKKRSQECIVSSYVYVFLVVIVGYIEYYEVEGQTKRKNDEEGLYFMTGWPSTIGSKPRVHTTET